MSKSNNCCSGSSNLNNSREGSKTIDASATSGSIHIDFNK